MKKVVTFLLISILSLALVACTSQEGVITKKQLDALEEDTIITKAEIKELFGEPLEIEGEQWIYDVKDGDVTLVARIAFLNDEVFGIVTGLKKD